MKDERVHCDYDKGNISVVICDTDSPQRYKLHLYNIILYPWSFVTQIVRNGINYICTILYYIRGHL